MIIYQDRRQKMFLFSHLKKSKSNTGHYDVAYTNQDHFTAILFHPALLTYMTMICQSLNLTQT